MESCVFCKVVSGNIPAEKIYEDQDTLAFFDIHPVNPGHILVISKQHHTNLYDLPSHLLSSAIATVQKIATALSKIADGINVGQNNGEAAGQVVMHAHFHIIPRYRGDGLQHWHGHPYNEREAKILAKKIKSLL